MNKICKQCNKELKGRQKNFCSLLCFNSSSSWKNTQKKKGEMNPRKGTGTFDEKEYARQYYKENKKQIKEKQKEYREKNYEKVYAQNRIYGKLWNKNNKGKKNSITYKYRTKKLNAIEKDSDMEKIKQFYVLAEKLTIQMGEKYCVDHIRPLIKGGKHHQDNLQVITLIENSRKGAKYPFQIVERFLPVVGFAVSADVIFFNPSPDQQVNVA